MKHMGWLASACAIAWLGGCATLPKFDNSVTKEKIAPRVSDMVDEIQREILCALSKSSEKDSPLAGLQNGQYVVNANLTLDVTDNQAVNPTLSYIDPLKAMSTNFTLGLNGQLSGTQHRNFNVTFTLLFDRLTPTGTACADATKGSGLKGDLGIAEIIGTGLRYETGIEDQIGYPYHMPAIGVTTLLANDPLTNSAAVAPNFGSTIDFTLIYGGGVGPSWTLTHFTGPSPAAGLVTYMRTNKDTLVLSFARVGATAPAVAKGSATEEEKRAYAAVQVSAIQGAAKASQDNVTRMILQRLLVP